MIVIMFAGVILLVMGIIGSMLREAVDQAKSDAAKRQAARVKAGWVK